MRLLHGLGHPSACLAEAWSSPASDKHGRTGWLHMPNRAVPLAVDLMMPGGPHWYF